MKKYEQSGFDKRIRDQLCNFCATYQQNYNSKEISVSCITSGNGRFHLEIMVIQRCSYCVILFSLKKTKKKTPFRIHSSV